MNAPNPKLTAAHVVRPASPERARGVLRLLAALLALAGAVQVAWPLVHLRLQKSPLRHETLLAPGAEGDGVSQTAVEQGDGAQLLVVDSVPAGAEVRVDGESQGNTPLSTELHCAAGAKVSLELRAPGYRNLSTAVVCAPDTLTRLRPHLVRR